MGNGLDSKSLEKTFTNYLCQQKIRNGKVLFSILTGKYNEYNIDDLNKKIPSANRTHLKENSVHLYAVFLRNL